MMNRCLVRSLRSVQTCRPTAARYLPRHVSTSADQPNVELHVRRELEYPLEGGVGEFLTPEGLRTIAVEWQEGLLNRLNEEVKDTELAGQSVMQTLINTSTQKSASLAFVYASQALNNSFFLDNLRPLAQNETSHEANISPALLQRIKLDFGSLTHLKSTVSAAALGMSSSGWVWLVQDASGALGVVPTFGAGTVLVRNRKHRAPTFTAIVGESSDPRNIPSSSASPQTPSAASPLTGSTVPRTSQKLTTDKSRTPPSREYAIGSSYSQGPSYNPGDINNILGQSHITDFTKIGDVLSPLFCISVHEHAWMSSGYGVWGKEPYLKKFWTALDWEKVSRTYEYWLEVARGPSSAVKRQEDRGKRTPTTSFRSLYCAFYHALDFLNAAAGLNYSFSPSVTFAKFRAHKFTWTEIGEYGFLTVLATFWVTIMTAPPFPYKLMIPMLYTTGIIIPFTSQFLVPATPVLAWVITFFSSRFIPTEWRPSISVSLLPTLESVLYGGNISDILTRYTNPVLDVLAWLPYGVIHFTAPFVVAIALWLWRGNAGKGNNEALKFWARAFGYMNLAGVLIQIVFPCAPPCTWYELIYGLTPANYSIHGAAGGLARIDALFHSNGYQTTFSASPVVFGAFPSLHSGCATMEALFISHFFPNNSYIWCYAALLYWATMYLTHHYLIDVVGGTCLTVFMFYFFLPPTLRTPYDSPSPFASTKMSSVFANGASGSGYSGIGRGGRSKHEQYDEERGPWRSGSPASSSGSHRSGEAPPPSGVPFLPRGSGTGVRGQRAHKHTASIASLIRADERVDEGWSPVGAGPNGTPRAFAFPRGSEDNGRVGHSRGGSLGRVIGELVPPAVAEQDPASGRASPRIRSPQVGGARCFGFGASSGWRELPGLRFRLGSGLTRTSFQAVRHRANLRGDRRKRIPRNSQFTICRSEEAGQSQSEKLSLQNPAESCDHKLEHAVVCRMFKAKR
ncbi:inositolphosphorylceramide synthase [Rhizoctonia solani AG-1 IA]|uniref:Inositolphosphorylceramide synthase n=1 Tax=Thanatephorus cucumeris (strain AG1-IA) TaxID=983506 RepID=L8WYC3_THACA|nr:inositolphosphorylceramide synthase [Rhizoctonia solani AG-1 IA]